MCFFLVFIGSICLSCPLFPIVVEIRDSPTTNPLVLLLIVIRGNVHRCDRFRRPLSAWTCYCIGWSRTMPSTKRGSTQLRLRFVGGGVSTFGRGPLIIGPGAGGDVIF